MKLFYIANIRIPTEKAHGVAIVKSCEALAISGVETALIVPRRRTPFEKSIFETYHVAPKFAVTFLPVIDLIREKAGPGAFLLEAFSFYFSLFFFLLFKSRSVFVYTREPDLIALRALGFKVIFECHVIPRKRASFFARAKKAHRIIVISQALKNAFIEEGFAPDSIMVAPSGVDLTIFDFEMDKYEARKRLDIPLDATVAVYTGNFTTMGEDKGIEDIIAALHNAPDVVFVAAGGSEKDRARYVASASAAGVLGRVILRGSTTQKMLALYQKAADVLLMPFPDTAHYRNHMSPVKMFEYMASQRPIIASDLPTIREVLSHENACIVKPGDRAALSDAMNLLTRNKEEGVMLAEHAYADVRRYSWHSRTEKVLAWLRG